MAITHIVVQRFGPWALVSGASSGIGAELARQLGASGVRATHVAGRASRWMLPLLPRRAATALMGHMAHRRFAAGALAAERTLAPPVAGDRSA